MDLWLSSQYIPAEVFPYPEVSGIPTALWHVQRRGGRWDKWGWGRSIKSCASAGQLVGWLGWLPETPGNLFCIWVHLVWTGEFPAPFILDKRGTFLTLHWITDNKNNLHTLPFSLQISSDVLFVRVCPVLYLAFFLSCKQLCSLFFPSAFSISPLLLLYSIFTFPFLLFCTLPSPSPACSLFVWLFGKEEGIHSSHWILLPTVPPIWPLWILQSMTRCQIVMLPYYLGTQQALWLSLVFSNTSHAVEHSQRWESACFIIPSAKRQLSPVLRVPPKKGVLHNMIDEPVNGIGVVPQQHGATAAWNQQ